ncbi:ROK family transcriptional regulator, partial [Mesorhizobium sp. M8A.F.Ca.ET.023.02.2.1]
TPRVIVASGGQHAVLRGAAALAVSGVLSPRFGQMFAAERERGRDILSAREIAA